MATHDTRRQSTESEVASSPATSTTCYQSASSSPDRARHQTPSEFERQAWGKGADGWHHPMTNGPRFVPGPGPMSRLTEPDIVRNGFPIDLLRLHAKKGPESAGTNHTDTIGMHPPACFRGDLKSSSQGDAALPPVGTPFGPTAQDTTSNGPGLDPHSASTRRTTDPRPSPYGEAGPNDKRKRNEFVQNVRKAAESNPSPSGQVTDILPGLRSSYCKSTMLTQSQTGTMQMLPHQRSNSQSSFNLNAGLHEVRRP